MPVTGCHRCSDQYLAGARRKNIVASPNWAERQAELLRLSDCQLFFIGGAPRSGTTWLQQILDCHPNISCRGEGLFLAELATPLETLIEQRRRALQAKNTGLFAHTGGYPLPDSEDLELLIGTGIMLSLHRQSVGKPCLAIGEKTPENVFFFPRLKQLFPAAKLIAIARDPRDVLTSAWHFFRRSQAGQNDLAAKHEFIRLAVPTLNDGARAIISNVERYTKDTIVVTYEALSLNPAHVVAKLFAFLGVSDGPDVVADCLERTAFAAQTGGRAAGVPQNGAFFRKGIVGDWTTTLTPEMSAMIVHELGWAFPYFGWQI